VMAATLATRNRATARVMVRWTPKILFWNPLSGITSQSVRPG
jgi:hypothetical protein